MGTRRPLDLGVCVLWALRELSSLPSPRHLEAPGHCQMFDDTSGANILLFISCAPSRPKPLPRNAGVTSTPNPLERRAQPIITADEHIGHKCWRRWGEPSSTGPPDPHDKCTVEPDGGNFVVTVHLWCVPNYPSGTPRAFPPVRNWQIAHLAHCQCQL